MRELSDVSSNERKIKMSSKLTLGIISLSLLIACANPKEAPAPAAASTPPAQQLTDSCALAFPQTGVCAQIVWEQPATDEQEGTFVIHWKSLEDVSLHAELSLPVSVVLWMPAMGHGSSPVRIERFAHGHDRVSEVNFIMPGEWEIKIQLKDGSNVIEEVVQKISI